MDKSIAMLWNSFLSLYGFWVEKIVSEHFEDNKGFGAFILIEVQVVTNWSRSNHLEITPNF